MRTPGDPGPGQWPEAEAGLRRLSWAAWVTLSPLRPGAWTSGGQLWYHQVITAHSKLDPIITKLNLPLATIKLIACNVHIWQRHSANKIAREHPAVISSQSSFILVLIWFKSTRYSPIQDDDSWVLMLTTMTTHVFHFEEFNCCCYFCCDPADDDN